VSIETSRLDTHFEEGTTPMFQALQEINWFTVALATVASSALGGLWFTVLFGRHYARALGRAHSPEAKPPLLYVVGPFFCTLLTTITSAVLLRAFHVTTTSEALGFGTIVDLGYLLATMVNTAINPNMPRPLLYSLVCGPYFFLGNLMVTLLLWWQP
jgi:hypothetical protein